MFTNPNKIRQREYKVASNFAWTCSIFCIFHLNTDTCVLWHYKMSHLKNKFSRFLHAKLSLIRIGWTACPHFSISLWPNFKLWCKSIPWNWTAISYPRYVQYKPFEVLFIFTKKLTLMADPAHTSVSQWKDWAEACGSPNPSPIRVNIWLQHGIRLLLNWVLKTKISKNITKKIMEKVRFPFALVKRKLVWKQKGKLGEQQ